MKKLVLAVLAVVFAAGAVFAESEINLKLGVDLAGKYRVGDDSIDMNTGINIHGEYLAAVSGMMKVGGGLQYLLHRNVDGVSGDNGIAFLPFYATVEVSPFAAIEELFFKGNIGYGFAIPENSDFDTESGLYYAIGAGYNFPNGFIIDVSYGWHDISSNDADATYSKLGINVGYKFKL